MNLAALHRQYYCSSTNIGATTPQCRRTLKLAPKRISNAVRATSDGQAPGTQSRESPTSSFMEFFDDLTRGSVSIDEDDLHPQAAAVTAAAAATATAAAAAADAAAATAGAAARAADGTKQVTAKLGEFEGTALAAVAAAAAAASGEFNSSSAAAASRSSSGSTSASAAAPGGAASKPPAAPAAASSGSSGSSRQAVTEEAVKGSAGGFGIQAAALSLTGEGAEVSAGQVAVWLLKCAVGLGALQAFKAAVEAGLSQLGVTSAIPPAVVSMLAVPVLLTAVGASTAGKVLAFYDNHLAPWTADLLGLFYVPAVAILPVLLRGMQGADLAGLLGVAALSTAATLLLTAKAAAAWTPASTAATPAAESAPPAAGIFRVASGPAAPVVLALSFLAAAGPLALTRFDPVNLGAQMGLPVGFAWSLLGYIATRVCLQQQENGGKLGWLSPVLVGAVAANVGVAWHGQIMGCGHLEALSRFYAARDVLGAGELLCAPLGAALTALGVLVYKHRAAISLRAIAATGVLSAAFSIATSWAAAKVLGVSTDWARALIPRSVTGSTASHFATAIGAPAECTGLVVLLQAAVTIAVGRKLLQLASGPTPDPAAAGTAVGVTGGAMGVAGVSGGNEVALANGALAYAFMLVLGGVLSSSPAVAAAIAAVVA